MPTKSIYFAKTPFLGAGKMHFLITPREVADGSSTRALLGSLVEEYDVGLFGMKEIPGIEHAWKRQYVLESIAKDPALAGQALVVKDKLAPIKQELKVEKKFKLGIGAPVPGVPAEASIAVEYTKLRTVDIELGKGCEKHYIPVGFVKSGYDFAQRHSNQFDRQLFYDDYMAVTQMLIVQQLKLTIESEIDFSAGFDAKAEEITALKLGVSYSKSTKRKYVIELDDGNQYLFAIGAVQLDQLKG